MRFLTLFFALSLTVQAHAAPEIDSIVAKAKALKFMACDKAKVGFSDMYFGPLRNNQRILNTADVHVIAVSKKNLPLFHQSGLVLVFKDRRTEWWDATCVAIVGFGSLGMENFKLLRETKEEVQFELQTQERVPPAKPGDDDVYVPGRLLKVHMDIVNTKITLE